MHETPVQTPDQDHIKCCVVTKGLLPIEPKGLYSGNEYGITLISLNEDYRARMEPGAASYADRLARTGYSKFQEGERTWIIISQKLK